MTEPQAPQNVTFPMACEEIVVVEETQVEEDHSGADRNKESLAPQPIPPSVRRLGWILDEAVPIPGTKHRFGLDFVLGLIPGLGDVTGMLLGVPMFATAVKRRLGWRVFLMMSFNVLIDAVGGFTPVLGNIFDFVWKGHAKNLKLLEDPQAASSMLREAGWKIAALAIFVVVLSFFSILLLLHALSRYSAWLFGM